MAETVYFVMCLPNYKCLAKLIRHTYHELMHAIELAATAVLKDCDYELYVNSASILTLCRIDMYM